VSTTRTPRLEALTGLRWFAAFWVFGFHVREFYPLPGMNDLALFGNSGVTFFFVLSGFVLTWSFTPSDTAPRFYWRRFARIWPALAVSTALAVPVFYAGRDVPFDHDAKLGVLASLTLVQAWWPSVLFAGNPAAWSLSDEGFFYALFPAVIRPLVRSPGWLLALLAFGLIGLDGWIRWWSWGAQPTAYQSHLLFISPAGRVAEFALGMVIAAAIRRGWRCPVPVWTAIALTAAGVWALWYCQTHVQPYLPKPRPDQAMNQVMGPLYALLIAAVASRDLKGRWMVLRSRPLVALGKWSYAFYLVHATVLYWLVQHWTPARKASWDNWRPAGVALVAGVAVAVALYALVEHPVEKALRRLITRRPPAARPEAEPDRGPEREPERQPDREPEPITATSPPTTSEPAPDRVLDTPG
jgi:peptidoglycan/LPS O-acetylase OafA/YrhL